MTDKTSNNKTSVPGNKKYLDNTEVNVKDAGKSNHTLHCSYDRESKSNFYTKKFEKLLRKSQMSSRKNIAKDKGKKCSFDHSLTEKGIIKNHAEKLLRNGTEDNQQNARNSVSETYKLSYCNVENSLTDANYTENQPDKILDKLNIVGLYENSEIIDVVGKRSEYRTDLDEKYTIFKSGLTNTAIATTDTFNTQELESGDENLIKKLKNIKNNSKVENVKIPQEKNNTDFKPAVKEFEVDNNQTNAIPQALNKKYLNTGVTRKKIFERLRNKEMEGNVNFKNYHNVITGNKRHKHKFLRENNNKDNRNCVGANIDKNSPDDDDDDNTVGNFPQTGFGIVSLTSNHEAKVYDEEGGFESRKNTGSVQNNTENSDAIEMLPMKNDAQSVAEKAWQDLTKFSLGVKRSRSEEEKDQENDLAKITIQNMINTARSRRKKIK